MKDNPTEVEKKRSVIGWCMWCQRKIKKDFIFHTTRETETGNYYNNGLCKECVKSANRVFNVAEKGDEEMNKPRNKKPIIRSGTIKIHWNGFLEHAMKECPKEACAFLFSSKPYSPEEEWFVYPVKNIDNEPLDRWTPSRKEMLEVKSKAIKNKLVKIGNIHSHPLSKNLWNEKWLLPSDIDLQFARKWNDIIRGILCVDKTAIYGVNFHDKFGNKINLTVVSDE